VTQLDRLNRIVVSLLGLLLLAAGAYGLLRGAGAFGDRRADEPLLGSDLRSFVADNDQWFWAAVAAVAILVAFAAASWLRAQLLPTPSLSELRIPTGQGPGRTVLQADAVSGAVRRDVEADPDVSGARVRLVPASHGIGLDVRATVVDGGDVHAVRARIEEEVLARARAALDREDVTATVRLRIGEPRARTLH
jgi:hypothetical protein